MPDVLKGGYPHVMKNVVSRLNLEVCKLVLLRSSSLNN